MSAPTTRPAKGGVADQKPPVGPAPTAANVLIVEDDAIVGLFLADLVDDLGYVPYGPAQDSETAIAAARDLRPDAVIVDISLKSDRDGLAVAAELKRLHDPAIIVMSGHGKVEAWPEVQALQPAAVLEKPCLPIQIEQALQQALGGQPPS